MKNTGKNQSDSCSAGEAAAALRVSIPTVKRMVIDGQLKGFRTPGGHLRISQESIRELRETHTPTHVSPVLQSRREQIEEITLETQRLRAQKELSELKEEEQSVADQRAAEAQARREEAAQARAQIRLERERLEYEQRQDAAREKQRQADDQRRREAERQLVAFHSRWQQAVDNALADHCYSWLSNPQRKEIAEAMEAEIKKRQPSEEPSMRLIVGRALAALLQPLAAEHEALEIRKRLTKHGLRSLPYGATDAEEVRARRAIDDAICREPLSADEKTLRATIDEAVKPICAAVNKRLLDGRVLLWASWQLPRGATDQEQDQLRRRCGEILAGLPMDVSEAEAKHALDSTVAQASSVISSREAEKRREAQKSTLLHAAITEASLYLLLRHDMSPLRDRELRTQVLRTIEEGLRNLTGTESQQEVQSKVHTLVDDAIAEARRPTRSNRRRRWQ